MKTVTDKRLEDVRDAFYAGGFVDIAPEPHPEGWEVQVTDDRGNCLASIVMPSKKQALGLIDLLVIS